MTDFFAAAVALAPENKQKKSKLADIRTPGMQVVGALKLLGTNIKSLQETLTDDLKSFAINSYFLKEGRATGRVPANFRGVEESGEGDKKIRSHGTIQLKAKSVTQVLTEDEIAELAEHGIPTRTETVGIDGYMFNPEVIGNPVHMAAIAKALQGIPGLPEDTLIKLTAVEKTVVSDETLPAIFAKAAEKDETGEYRLKLSTVKALVAMVTTPAVAPNFGSTDVKRAYELVRPMLTLDTATAPVAETPVAEAVATVANAVVEGKFDGTAAKTPAKGRAKKAA